MLSQNTNSQQNYSEAQVTHWLSWLARGMRQHGQTIFLIEQLQPSWLPERRWQKLYVFLSALLDGLMFGLIIALVAGLTIGLASAAPSKDLREGLNDGLQGLLFGGMVGFFFGIFKSVLDWSWLDQKSLWQRAKKLPSRWQAVIYVILAGLLMVLAYILDGLVFIFIESFQNPVREFFSTLDFLDFRDFVDYWNTELILVGVIVGGSAILLWSVRSLRQSLVNHIRTVESLSWSWASAFNSTIFVLRFTLAAIVIFFIYILGTRWNSDLLRLLGNELFIALISSLACAFAWEIRQVRRSVQKEEQPTLSGWSWKRLMHTVLAIFPLAIIIILFIQLSSLDEEFARAWGGVYFYIIDDKTVFLIMLLFTGVMVALVRGAFAGLKMGVVEMKVRPNEGIRLSMRNALLGGGSLGGILGLGSIILTATFLKRLDLSTDEIFFGSFAIGGLIAVVAGLFASLWYGGQDVVRHYILRYILYRHNYTPRRFVHFLDYAANELNFLQKVGGGYMFIHRYLLEHFAAMTEEAGSVKTQT